MKITLGRDFSVSVSIENNTATISANRDGLLTLANIFAALSEEPAGERVQLDEYNSLEDDSAELVIRRID